MQDCVRITFMHLLLNKFDDYVRCSLILEDIEQLLQTYSSVRSCLDGTSADWSNMHRFHAECANSLRTSKETFYIRQINDGVLYIHN